LNIEILNCGYCLHPKASTLPGGGFKSAEYPSSVALIEHPKEGIILFDTGYTNHFIEATKTFPERFYQMMTRVFIEDSQTAVSQLRKRGIQPEDVSHVIISHFHGDHVAGLKDFPRAQFTYFGEGYEFVRGLGRVSAVKNGFLSQLIPEDFLVRSRTLLSEQFSTSNQGSNLEKKVSDIFGGFFDLFSDGSLLLVPLPGHFPGHMGLLANLNSKPLFFVGDACWHIANLDKTKRPPFITLKFLNSTPDYHQTLDKIVEFKEMESDLDIIPCHCDASIAVSNNFLREMAREISR
jgi:glyoxylase-like metal-dependent hydrolase (beta-lactamase superfamily II)